MGFKINWDFAVNPFAAASQIAGDYLGAREQRKAQDAANDANRAINEQNLAAQREFAQHGIRWRTEDAQRAGLHPLIGAGVQPTSLNFQPIAADADFSRADFYRNMGQNLGRSIQATQTEEERIANRLRLENMGLQNELLRTQITNISNPTNPPAPVAGPANFNIDGQGNAGVMRVTPSERVDSARGRPAQEAGWRPDVSYSRTDSGLVPVIPEGLSESMEDDVVGKVLWRIRNQVMPNLTGGGRGKPARSELPKGAIDWKWSYSRQEWQPEFGYYYQGGRR